MLLLAGCTGVLDMFGRAAGPPATVCVPSLCARNVPGAVAAAERRLQVRLSCACVQDKICSLPAAACCDRNAFRIRPASHAWHHNGAAVRRPNIPCLTSAS